jgi:hypothetical protein
MPSDRPATSKRNALILGDIDPARIPAALRGAIEGISLASYIFVEASKLDGIKRPAVLAWLRVAPRGFEHAEQKWSTRIAEALVRDATDFHEVYEELLGNALNCWARVVTPLEEDLEAWVTFRRHTKTHTPKLIAKLGLTRGDVVRLTRSWRARLADPEIAELAAKMINRPLEPMPKITVAPLVFPPSRNSTTPPPGSP